MWRKIVTVSLFLFASINIIAQLDKHFAVRSECSFDQINFKLIASTGSCNIRSSADANSINIFGPTLPEALSPNFKTHQENQTKYVDVNIESKQTDVLDLLTNDRSEEWNIELNPDKKISLNLEYGYGISNIDLSDIKTDKFVMNTGSADVLIQYGDNRKNLCFMDTFKVKVELGSLVTKNLIHSRASTYIADVSFGSALLDLNAYTKTKANIVATVGAGSLEIITDDSVPTIIYLKHSPLCTIKLPDSYQEIKDYTYVNQSYRADANNLRSFDIDVALGSITFTTEHK